MGLNHSPSIVRDGLVLHLDAANKKSYPGTGSTWNDLSGNGSNSTLVNGAVFNSSNAGSIVFDGVDDYVSTNFIGSSSSFSCEVFLKPTNVSKDQMYAGYSSIAAFYFRILGSRAFTSISANGQRTLTHSQTLLNNNYYHIVSIYNGVELKIYVNNSLTSGTAINQPLFGSGITRIGRWLDGDQRSFVGNIYAFKFYNRELSATEVKQNFDALRGRFGI